MSVVGESTRRANEVDTPLRDYAVEQPGADLFASAEPAVVAKWHALAEGLRELSPDNVAQLHEQVAREIQELGLTYRMTGEAEERPWPLNPMPLLIGSREWLLVERGLIQRAGLLERIVADIYGSQQLVADGDLPASMVAGSPHFAHEMIGSKPPGGHFIHVYAVDLARGPSGEWRVLSDRLRFATGIGYALENRLALSRSTGSILSQINARRLARFYRVLRQGIAADCQRDDPRIALLSPGGFNQSYPEQAHLARYLGLPLVEGRDLTVSDAKLYVRTIAGPKRIDALWNWIDTPLLDPLTFNADSHIGVPGLSEAWSKGGLSVANWPGVGVLEARAFSAFMPRLATKLIGEPLLLPNMATWWCGQAPEADSVRRNLDGLVISSSFGTPVECLPDGRSRLGASFDAQEREALLADLERRPMDYCGQEIVRLSTTPALIGSRLEPRPFTLRAFVVRGPDGAWEVMPGGFARLSSSGNLRTSLMDENDRSADVCVVDDLPVKQESLLGNAESSAIKRGGGILSSQAADNLYWFSRYVERAEMTVRILKSLLGSSIEADGGAARGKVTLDRLVNLLILWGAIASKDAAMPLSDICRSAFGDEKPAGSVRAIMKRCRRISGDLRDRLATDVGRIARQPLPVFEAGQVETMLKSFNEMIARFSALAGLAAENMVRGPSWRFLQIGRRMERATNLCRIARQLSSAECEQDDLGILLDLCDSQIVYRARYLVGLAREPVLDLVLLDPNNPRSLAFQLIELEQHLSALPTLLDDGLPERPLLEIRAIVADLRAMEANGLADDRLHDMEKRLLGLSDAVSQRYFLQYEKAAAVEQSSFLA
ncbi:circularly permuted type 2 ATP-grasp protein [Novosphingobium sp. CECT 9465]|uniref:circularly permuted type 2 ATP-grasp protein n=1 Tax=Novosphingobium sp. CECT 9465 TaxID=2829794 RepID=UPI001E432DBB|nr:circularly permuted type 2 ATP-grasp protein [Novosphingobium sp. CECT 9465]CAH0498149.1 hypothetical protein NVSP9465_03225 [Novosphingobium sp. CECT 9465]